MEQYHVTGMSCAACSARVEKAVSKVPGVTSCSVSLLTNSMGVEGTAPPSAVIAAVEEAGYGASEKKADAKNGLSSSGAGGARTSMSAAEDSLADKETPKMKKRLIASFILSIHKSKLFCQILAILINAFSGKFFEHYCFEIPGKCI